MRGVVERNVLDFQSFFFFVFSGRHKQAMLEAYDQQEARIFAEYHKRLQVYVTQARG